MGRRPDFQEGPINREIFSKPLSLAGGSPPGAGQRDVRKAEEKIGTGIVKTESQPLIFGEGPASGSGEINAVPVDKTVWSIPVSRPEGLK